MKESRIPFPLYIGINSDDGPTRYITIGMTKQENWISDIGQAVAHQTVGYLMRRNQQQSHVQDVVEMNEWL